MADVTAPQGFGVAEAPQTPPEGFGFPGDPVPYTPPAPVNAPSVATQYASVSGEDPAKLQAEIDHLGPYQALDRIYGTTFAKQQENLRAGVAFQIDAGNPEAAADLARRHAAEYQKSIDDSHTELEKQLSVATAAVDKIQKKIKYGSDGEATSDAAKLGGNRGFLNTFLNTLGDGGKAVYNYLESTVSSGAEELDHRWRVEQNTNPDFKDASMLERAGRILWDNARGAGQFVLEGGAWIFNAAPAALYGTKEAIKAGDVHAFAPNFGELHDALQQNVRTLLGKGGLDTVSGRAALDAMGYAFGEWMKGGKLAGEKAQNLGAPPSVAAGIETVIDAIPLVLGAKSDLASAYSGVRDAVRKGQAARVVQAAAGNEAAGKMVGDQLNAVADGVTTRATTDLSTHDAASTASAAGTNFAEPHPLNLEGLSPKVQEELLSAARDAKAKIDAAIKVARPEEIASYEKAATELESSYAPEVRSDVHSVELWDSGPKANFLSPDGTPFMSKAGAELHMQEHGLTGEIVDVRDLPARRFDESGGGPGGMPSKSELYGETATARINEIQVEQYQKGLDTGDKTVPLPGSPEAKARAKQAYQYEVNLRRGNADKTVKANADLATVASNVQEGLAHLERRQEIIRQSLDRFDNSASPVIGSAKTPRHYVDLARRILEKVGLGDEKVLVGHMDELADLHRDIEGQRVSASGLYLRPEGDRPFHVILLNDVIANMNGRVPTFQRVKAMTTFTHEIGHLIWNKIISSDQWKPVRTAIVRAFEEDAKRHPGNANLFKRNRQAPNLIAGAQDGQFTLENFDVAGNSERFQEWVKSHEERFVEHLSKAMYKDARTLTPIEQALKPVVDVMRKMYDAASAAFGFKADEAHPLVQSMFKKLLDNVAAGKFNVKELTYSERNAGFRADVAPPRDLGPEGYVIRTDAPEMAGRRTEGGTFTEDDINGMHYYALDPKHGASLEAVEARVVGIHAQERVVGALRDLVRKPWQALSKTSQRTVSNVLVEGDRYRNLDGSTGREFTAAELMAGGLSEKEMKAYFAVRQARNLMHGARDAEMVRDLQAQGYENVVFSVVEGSKPATATAAAIPGVGRNLQLIGRTAVPEAVRGKYVWDVRQNKGVLASEDSIGSGRVVELRDPQQINGKWFKHVLVDSRSAKTSALTTVLPYRAGEFARIYTDEYFAFIRRKGQQIDGVAVPEGFDSVIRSAKSEMEAKAYVESMRQAKAYLDGVADGSIVSRNPRTKIEELIGKHTNPDRFMEQHAAGEFADAEFQYKYTRSKDDYLTNFTGSALAERPFYGHRGERIYSVNERRPNTLSVMKSIEAEISNTSRAVTIGDWRRTMIQKWMNTFGDILEGSSRSGNDIADFYRLGDENGMVKFGKNDRRSRFAERTYNYIRKQLGVRTAEERSYQNIYRAFTEFVEPKLAKVTGQWLPATMGAWIRQTSFLNMVRSVNFNLTLGMFNPAQLFVQANGMMTAAAIHPLHGLRAAKTYPLLRMALMSDRADVHAAWGKLNSLSEMGLASHDEFVNLVAAIRKTGIIENLRSTALHNLEDGSLGITQGYGGKFLAAGRWFFNRGEEASRLMSFDIARREFMDRNPGVDWTSDAALKQITIRMDDYTQNMTRANQAAWQRGILAIPIQFLQYNVKLAQNASGAFVRGIERNVLGEDKPYRGFTSAEMAKIMTAHLVMYGMAGYGLVNMMDEVLGDENANKLTPEEKAYMAEGLISGLIATATSDEKGEGGVHLAIGSRLASFDMWSRLASGLFGGKTTVYEAMLGPTKSTIDHAAAAANIVKLWSKGASGGTTPEAIIDAFKAFTTEEVASLRNATRAYYYFQNAGRMIDKNGTPIVTLKNQEILAAALGLTPTAAVDYYNLLQDKKQVSNALDDIAHDVYKLQREALYAAQRDDWPTWEKKNAQIQALWPDNVGDYEEVKRRIKDNLFPHDTEMQKLLGQYMQHSYHPDRTTPFTVTTPAGSNPAYGK